MSVSDVLIARAIRSRKITAAQAPVYREMFATAPEQATTLLAGPVAQGGLASRAVPAAAAPEEYPAEWVPEVTAHESRAQPGGEYPAEWVKGSEPGAVRRSEGEVRSRVAIEPDTPGVRERQPGRERVTREA